MWDETQSHGKPCKRTTPWRLRDFANLRKISYWREEFYNFIWTSDENVLNVGSRTQERREAKWFCDLLVTRNNPFGLVAGRIPKVGLSGPVSRGGSLLFGTGKRETSGAVPRSPPPPGQIFSLDDPVSGIDMTGGHESATRYFSSRYGRILCIGGAA